MSFQYQSSNEARQAACSTPSGKKEKVIVALTGYDKENGEYDTTCEAVRSLVTVISNKKGQLPAGYSTNENSTIDPYETSVEVVRDSEARQRDFTHLVVGKYTDKRTLRILYALARNVYIIKDDWIYDCICSDCWVDPMDHRLERYSSMICGGEPLRLFKNKLFCLLHSRKPENKILIDLIEIAGGRVTTDVFTEEKVNYYLVGDRDDLRDWLLAHMRNKSHDIVQAVIANAGTHMQLVTCKYIFNCLEEQNVRYALKREEESYSQIDMQELEAEITLALKDRRCMDAIMSRSKNITIKQEHDGQRCIKYSGETLMSPKRPAPSSSSSKTNISNEVFKNKKICVLKISDPTEQQQLVASIEAAQGCITGDVSTSERLHYFLVRNRDDFKAWLLEQEPDIIQHIKTVITNEKTQIVTAKVSFKSASFLCEFISTDSCTYCVLVYSLHA